MSLRMVTLSPDPLSDRRLNLVVGENEAYAFVAGGPPPEQTFQFSIQNLRWVLRGLSYQAMGLGGHFSITPTDDDEVLVEFKSSSERRITRFTLPMERFARLIDPISQPALRSHAEVL